MELEKKIAILADAAKYDNSCSSSGSRRETPKGGIGHGSLGGICHSWSADGRCVSLLKILLTNYCKYDCKYCYNRRSNDIRRAIFEPKEIAYLTYEFYRRNYIEGLFLSSGIFRSPDYTMELMIESASILRKKYLFGGYIHLKIIPGAAARLIRKAIELADRVSCNIELPSERSLMLLAPDKKQAEINNSLIEAYNYKMEREKPVSTSTQLIIGASPESDKSIIKLAEKLYSRKLIKRVYYSAYIPVNNDGVLPQIENPPILREHRLYQADWLIRFYRFSSEELFEENENLPEDMDPKMSWALKNPQFFPVDIMRASYEELIRVPGIGLKSAMKIISARKYGTLDERGLSKLGISIKRAKAFITIKGKVLTTIRDNETETIALSKPKQLSLLSR